MPNDIKTWQVCSDCRIFIAYDDASSLDYWFNQETSERILETMKSNLENQSGYAVVLDVLPEDYHNVDCDCCNSPLHPIRYKVVFQE